jgi:hypothetical protein
MPVTDLKPLVLDLSIDPWEHQPKETVLRFNQFCHYRDLGRSRTLAAVAVALNLNARYVRSLSAAYQWGARAEAFDRHRDARFEQSWLETRRKAATNDATLLDAAVGKVARRLGNMDPAELEVSDVIRLLDVVLRQRRALFPPLALAVEVTGPGGDPVTVQLAEFAQMSSDQRRRAVAELAAQVTRRAQAAAGADDDE